MVNLRFYFFICLILVFPLILVFYATSSLAISKGTGLALPRFVSLRADEVNLRTGPGVQYPVDWVYLRQHLPVQIIAEFDTWRKIRDWQGTQGWVHQSMVSGCVLLLLLEISEPFAVEVIQKAHHCYYPYRRNW